MSATDDSPPNIDVATELFLEWQMKEELRHHGYDEIEQWASGTIALRDEFAGSNRHPR